jgi:hypothetical protein
MDTVKSLRAATHKHDTAVTNLHSGQADLYVRLYYKVYTLLNALNLFRPNNSRLRSLDKISPMRDNAPTRSQKINKLMM